MALSMVMISVLLAHVHTWTVIISVAFVFLVVSQIFNYYPRKNILILYFVLSSSVVADILKFSLTGSSIGLEADASIGLQHGFGISHFDERFRTLAQTILTYYGGAYANIGILGANIVLVVSQQGPTGGERFYTNFSFKCIGSPFSWRLGVTESSPVRRSVSDTSCNRTLFYVQRKS